MHLLVDTTWELPIAFQVIMAKEADITNLIPLIEKAKQRFPWFKPWHVTADKGCVASYNYKAISDMGSIPIIKMREKAKGQEGRFTINETGIPKCQAGFQLLLRSHTPEKGMQYICPFKAGKVECPSTCSLRVAWIRPLWEYRQLCPIPRDSLYRFPVSLRLRFSLRHGGYTEGTGTGGEPGRLHAAQLLRTGTGSGVV